MPDITGSSKAAARMAGKPSSAGRAGSHERYQRSLELDLAKDVLVPGKRMEGGTRVDCGGAPATKDALCYE